MKPIENNFQNTKLNFGLALKSRQSSSGFDSPSTLNRIEPSRYIRPHEIPQSGQKPPTGWIVDQNVEKSWKK